MDFLEKHRLSDNDRLNLCDIIWWFKGFNAALPYDEIADIGESHFDSIRRVNSMIQKETPKGKEQ